MNEKKTSYDKQLYQINTIDAIKPLKPEQCIFIYYHTLNFVNLYPAKFFKWTYPFYIFGNGRDIFWGISNFTMYNSLEPGKTARM